MRVRLNKNKKLLCRPGGGTRDASPKVSYETEAGDLIEEVGGGTGWGQGLQGEIEDAEKPKAGRHGSWEYQEARLAVVPGEDGALLTSTGRRTGSPRSAGGAGIKFRLENTSSRCVLSGRPNR